MTNKNLKKISRYARQHQLNVLAIAPENGRQVLRGENASQQYRLVIDSDFASDLSNAYRRLLSLAPDNLVSNAYLKDDLGAMRLSIIPEADGEKIILQFINDSAGPSRLSRLGLDRDARAQIKKFLNRSRALVLIIANNHQGKTTTLHALTRELINPESAGVILEKYSEAKIDKVSIVREKNRRVQALEKLKKQDHDWIAIDDADEKLLIASLNAASEGRLVLVTHNSDQPAQIATWLKKTATPDLPLLIIYQEIKDRNCPNCLSARPSYHYQGLLERYWPSEKKYRPTKFFHSRGCYHCHHSGVQGKTAVFAIEESKGGKIEWSAPLSTDLIIKAANGLIAPENKV
ncbi:MAG: ATPase, T2SS/T4P/T4SS family [Patescibacteria group bacterium]|jgi:type II secretory ATPase GspE/PulE/Tfp pilus assembly ATPase PilB-like protein|nr:ATPase, T2SS/T4P/T4SS family [Patescibacteria group bacterium]MDD3434945.1 ATPase, T2SS/T4P/T4SS family [Patescibacteria group bacterium]